MINKRQKVCKKNAIIFVSKHSAQSILILLTKDYIETMNYCEMVYNANYALIPELAETVARMYDDNQMPDKAAVVRAKEKLQTE